MHTIASLIEQKLKLENLLVLIHQLRPDVDFLTLNSAIINAASTTFLSNLQCAEVMLRRVNDGYAFPWETPIFEGRMFTNQELVRYIKREAPPALVMTKKQFAELMDELEPGLRKIAESPNERKFYGVSIWLLP